MSLEYDTNTILPDDLTIDLDDETLEELEGRLSTVHALADVLERACRSARPPRPEAIALVLNVLGQAYLASAVADVRSGRRALRYMADRRASA